MDALVAVERGVPGPAAGAAAAPGRRSSGAGAIAGRGRRHGRGALGRRARACPCPSRPFSGSGSSRASSWPSTPPTSTSARPSSGQWGLRGSAAARAPPTRSWSRPRAARGCGCGWSGCRPRGLLEAAVVYGSTPASPRGTTWCSCTRGGGRRRRPAERTRFTFPAQRRDRRLCLADFFRSREEAAELGGPDVWPPAGHHGPAGGAGDRRAVREERLPRLPRAARLSRAADRGPGRVLARPGARRPRASPTRTTRARGDPAAGLPRLALLLRLPGLPRPGGPPKLVALLRPERIGVELSEELQLHPEQSTDALVVHHPEAKYFNAT
jgi:5-methyltetrahydrofolate--homocysteine methyltransferase